MGDLLTKYLLVINIIGFFVFLLNKYLYDNTPEGNVDKLLTIVSLLGGSLGIILSILIFDRKAEKGNMMSRVFVICIFIIQVVLFLTVRGYHIGNYTQKVINFLNDNNIIILYLIVINAITFVLYGIDKKRAKEGRWRIRIVTLLGFAFAGGSIGALLGMKVFNHKIHVDYFTVGIPLIIIAHLFLVFYFLNP